MRAFFRMKEEKAKAAREPKNVTPEPTTEWLNRELRIWPRQ
jgi:hypothetical protein